jgi:hypothetical protein
MPFLRTLVVPEKAGEAPRMSEMLDDLLGSYKPRRKAVEPRGRDEA